MYNFSMIEKLSSSNRFIFCILALTIIVIIFNSFFSTKEVRRSFIAWGTNLDFIVISEADSKTINKIINEAQDIAVEKSKIFNNYDKESEVSQFNQLDSKKEMRISNDFRTLYELSNKYNKISDKYFDITLGRITSMVNYETTAQINMTRKEYEKIIEECTGLEKIIYKSDKGTISKENQCIQIDFGGIAEGYVINLMIESLIEDGIQDAMINFGGNITTISTNHDWKSTIRNSNKKNDTESISVQINNLSISTSNTYSKSFLLKNKIKSHIIDPISNSSKNNKNLSISVVSDDPIFADAISTALISMPLEIALSKISTLKNAQFLVIEYNSDGKSIEIFNNLK